MSDFDRFSVQEFFIGCVAAVSFFFVVGYWALLTVPACGVLWMLGGTYHKIIRRFGVPFTLWLHVEIYRGWPAIDLWPVLGFFLGLAILHIGDGFPDNRPTTQDEGSFLGRLVERYITANDSIGGPLTKWLIALIFQVSLIPYWLLK